MEYRLFCASNEMRTGANCRRDAVPPRRRGDGGSILGRMSILHMNALLPTALVGGLSGVSRAGSVMGLWATGTDQQRRVARVWASHGHSGSSPFETCSPRTGIVRPVRPTSPRPTTADPPLERSLPYQNPHIKPADRTFSKKVRQPSSPRGDLGAICHTDLRPDLARPAHFPYFHLNPAGPGTDRLGGVSLESPQPPDPRHELVESRSNKMDGSKPGWPIAGSTRGGACPDLRAY